MSNKFLKFEVNRPFVKIEETENLDQVFISLTAISSICLLDVGYAANPSQAPSKRLALTITLTNKKHYERILPANTLLSDAESMLNNLLESIKGYLPLSHPLYALGENYVKFDSALTRECNVNFINPNNIEVIEIETLHAHLPELEKFAIHIVMVGGAFFTQIFSTREEAQEFLGTLLSIHWQYIVR